MMILRSRRILLASILLLFFGLMFYFYHSTVDRLIYSDAALPESDVCPDTCLDVRKMEYNMLLNNCTAVSNMVQHETRDSQLRVEKNDEDVHESEILILVWVWPFGSHFDVNSCKSIFGIRGCRITDDRSQYDKAHGVLFHVREITNEISNLIKMARPPLQKWVWMNSEPPSYTPRLPGAQDLFNLTSSYRRDSDIWSPYGRIVHASEEEKAFKIPQKDKVVCWIISNWNERFKRVRYFKELSHHINIDGYGQHFGRALNNEDYFRVISSCKFYLSFENSIHKDYISEKFFNPMRFGTVPVVMGPPRENYEEFIPGDSFIHVDDFQSPKDLAEHLHVLDQNQELYERYFEWRKHFVAQLDPPQEHACRTCEYLRMYMNFRVFKNVDQWFFNEVL